MPNPLKQFPDAASAAQIARGKFLFTAEVADGGSGCASCHHNGNKITNGQVDDTFQDFNIHEPGVIAETTVSNDGVFLRLDANYIFEPFATPSDSGGRQNISSRNTKHLRAFWDSVPRWLPRREQSPSRVQMSPRRRDHRCACARARPSAGTPRARPGPAPGSAPPPARASRAPGRKATCRGTR